MRGCLYSSTALALTLLGAHAFVAPGLQLRRPAVSNRVSMTTSPESSSWGLIFDCDGVILESEGLHRDAYNAVFKEFEVDYNWSPEYYDELQNLIGGGKPKMRHYFGVNGWPASKLGPPPSESADQDALIDALQDRKTEIYKEMIASGTVPVRPGFNRLVDEALALPGAKLAICSASTKDACVFVLDNLLGKEQLAKFEVVLAGDDVERRKPDPSIYVLASEMLGVPADRCIVVEDSLIGLQAALGAQMRCVITHTPSTATQDFSGAIAVYPELGDGDGVQVTAQQLYDMLPSSVTV